MAEPMIGKTVMPTAVLLLGLAGLAHAQELPDPTRPPASLGAPGSFAAESATTGPVLQSVLISANRKVAVISGQTVREGQKIGDERVVRISESQVDLSSGSGTRTLKLFPDVGRRPVSGTHAGTKTRRQ